MEWLQVQILMIPQKFKGWRELIPEALGIMSVCELLHVEEGKCFPQSVLAVHNGVVNWLHMPQRKHVLHSPWLVTVK